MRVLLSTVVCLCAACAGVSVGDSGAKEVPRCADQHAEPISDCVQTPHDFARPAKELLSPATGTWTGSLELEQGSSVPLTVEMAIDPSSVVAVYATDYDRSSCEPWLTAELEIAIDAGKTLNGTATGKLSTRNESQIRVDWAPFTDFDSTLQPPDFGDAIERGPALQLWMLQHDNGSWHGDLAFAAQVASKAEPCGSSTKMCTSAPGSGSPEPESEPFGKFVLGPAKSP